MNTVIICCTMVVFVEQGRLQAHLLLLFLCVQLLDLGLPLDVLQQPGPLLDALLLQLHIISTLITPPRFQLFSDPSNSIGDSFPPSAPTSIRFAATPWVSSPAARSSLGWDEASASDTSRTVSSSPARGREGSRRRAILGKEGREAPVAGIACDSHRSCQEAFERFPEGEGREGVARFDDLRTRSILDPT